MDNNNLTFMQNIIRVHTPDALEGHTVVVLEKMGAAGEIFRYQLTPGQIPPKRPLNLPELFKGDHSGPAYLAFAVTDNNELRTSTTVDVKTDDQKHSFSVTIQIAFKVANARLLVARRDDDPVQQMKEETASVIAQGLARKSWAEIRQSFRDIEKEIVPKVIPALRRFADSYGLGVETLALGCHLSEQDMRLIEQEAEADLATERQKIALRQAIALRPLQAKANAQTRQDRVFEAAADAAAQAIRNVPGSIHTVAELVKSFETFVRYSGNGGEELAQRLIEETAASNTGMNGNAALIADALAQIAKLSCGFTQKRMAQSAVLHLIAELLLEDPDSQTVDRYRKSIEAMSGPANPANQIEALERFADTEWLREQLA